MKYLSKISITCMIFILCSLVATQVIAEEEIIFNPGSAEQANVMSSSSGNVGNIMNSLPELDEAGNVINPSSDSLGNIMNSFTGEEVNVLSEPQTALWQGQSSQVYRVTLNCPGTVRLSSSYGARFNLHAKKNTESGICPSANSLRYNYDKIAYGYGGTTTMALEAGVWCLMVNGYSGSGTYSLRVSSYCSNPTPWPTPYPTTTPIPCDVYKTDSRQGFLNQGQAAVYGYSIPSDSRSKIEWTMTSSASSQGGATPIIIASAGNPSVESSSSGGSSTFDLYVFKDCNPRNSGCNTRYYSYGPNSHVSIAYPSTGSIYYVMVYARAGSGTFDLKMNSYKCTSGDVPIIVAAASVNSQDLTDSSDNNPESEVSSPAADFIRSDVTG